MMSMMRKMRKRMRKMVSFKGKRVNRVASEQLHPITVSTKIDEDCDLY